MAITCCRYCVPPKRYPGCGDHCPEYAEQKAQHNAQIEAHRKEKKIQDGIDSQKFAGVERARKKRRR